MIGKIYTPPVFFNNRISHDNATQPEKNLKNQVTGSVINVKNTSSDFRIISKELSLYRDIKNHPILASVADTQSHNNQDARLSSLGMAVTAIYNMVENGKAKEKSVEICDKIPRNQSVELNFDSSLTKRGAEYINQFLEAETPLDSTNYATGLRVGSDIKNTVLDPIMINQFNSTWNIRLNMAT
ncbi:TPA: hypothetical protein ACYJG3_002882 [Salmonella enterica]|nr:hypothetical protein [Salmonella enterica subsp. salamae]ECJ2430836.1 hypothetical protein [Salmonella enterica subsp. salamae]EDB1777829.1 hypothetical protein [Salmonella enterica subsp. salamae]EDZ7162301.1 hypothetical protein [Salmonella enterica subsp. salamae]MJK48614.1 hypothetical protein [Salmonella enterica subsp. salamae]